MLQVIKEIKKTFDEHKWLRYLETNNLNLDYPHKICFYFSNKQIKEFYLTEENYKEWRKIL